MGETPMETRRVVRAFKKSSRSVAILLLRRVGAVIPAPVLWCLLWPLVLIDVLRGLVRGGPSWSEFRELNRLPPIARGRRLTPVRLALGRARLNFAELLVLWPNRLASAVRDPRRIRGREWLERIESRERPILLLTLHYGPLPSFFGWLRTRKAPVAVVAFGGHRNLSRLRGDLARVRDARAGLEGCPRLFEPGEVWAMRDHLAARGVLLVVIDGGTGGHVGLAEAEGVSLAMNTGSLRLAAATDALVIPCLARSGWFFSLIPSFGEPLPPDLLRSRRGEAAARTHLLREFLPMLTAAPEECSDHLLGLLRGAAIEYESPEAVPPSPRTLGAEPPATAGA